MNRLQRKCLAASLALHALLCVILLVGPAFLSSNKKGMDQPTLEVIPARIVDSLFSGGGNPKGQPPAAQPSVEPPAPVQRPEPRPPEPTPKPPQIKEQVVEKKQPAVETKPARETVEKAPKPEIKVSTTIVKRASEKDKEDKARADADAKAKARAEAKARAKAEADARRRTAQQLEARLSGAYESLSKNLSSGTTIEPIGPGGGGEPYADYGQVVKSYYDQAWIDPDEVSEDAATVRVKVVIRRDGTVIADPITQRSGIPALDKSVQNALDRVRVKGLPPFPEGAKESQRIYIINFNLKAKRFVG